MDSLSRVLHLPVRLRRRNAHSIGNRDPKPDIRANPHSIPRHHGFTDAHPSFYSHIHPHAHHFALVHTDPYPFPHEELP